MKKRAFLISGLVMTATALFLKTVDISYTVYISNKIGAEGMGLYQLIVSVYCLFITVSTSGISLAGHQAYHRRIGQGQRKHRPLRHAKMCGSKHATERDGGECSFLFGGAHRKPVACRFAYRTLPAGTGLRAAIFGGVLLLNGYFLAKRRVVKSSAAQIFRAVRRNGRHHPGYYLVHARLAGIRLLCHRHRIGGVRGAFLPLRISPLLL